MLWHLNLLCYASRPYNAQSRSDSDHFLDHSVGHDDWPNLIRQQLLRPARVAVCLNFLHLGEKEHADAFAHEHKRSQIAQCADIDNLLSDSRLRHLFACNSKLVDSKCDHEKPAKCLRR